ncbi:MAG: YtxH domain-containing protein [Rhodothermaceae bacterium]|nr:YtxH domain-containing protein [Rhodothermaceae bacterium]
MSDSRRTLQASVVGLLVGGAAGFALGILMAPDEGRQVRQRAAYLLDRWSGQLTGLINRLAENADQSEARKTADALVADAREQAQQLLSEADALMSEARERRGGDPPLRRAS